MLILANVMLMLTSAGLLLCKVEARRELHDVKRLLRWRHEEARHWKAEFDRVQREQIASRNTALAKCEMN